MFDLKKLCYFLVAINVLVILFNVSFLRNVGDQTYIETTNPTSSETQTPNINIDITPKAPKPIDKDSPYVSVEFEIFGKVQNVFFRKNTQEEASKLGLVGWVFNSKTGTVEGLMQGTPAKVAEMKKWLCETGSPKSTIEKCVFTNEEGKEALTYKQFIVMK